MASVSSAKNGGLGGLWCVVHGRGCVWLRACGYCTRMVFRVGLDDVGYLIASCWNIGRLCFMIGVGHWIEDGSDALGQISDEDELL